MTVSEIEALARTFSLEELELSSSDTIFPGTLAERSTTPIDPSALPRLDIAGAAEDREAEVMLASMLGKGGMGVVWLARQRSLERAIAVKQVARAEDAAALFSEARTTGALEHPSIVPVHALGVDEAGAPVMVMKRIEGASLGELLRDPGHPAWPALERRHGGRLEACLEALMRVADALHFAHARGFVHRDVKPDNVMLGAFGEVYLLDWGVALKLGAGAGREIVGTPAFMAPELARGDVAAIDARTDVYLLGATLHAVLTGGESRHTASNLLGTLTAALLSEPIAYDSGVNAELAELANRATSADLDSRPATALELREALAAHFRHRASGRLCERAAKKLADIGDDPAALASSADALIGARATLGQALEEWPENVEAKRLMRRAQLGLVKAQLHQRSAEAAAAMARELDPPEPELEAAIDALREELRTSERLADAARAEERERDPTVERRARIVFFVVMIVGMFVVATAILKLSGGDQGSQLGLIAGNTGALVFLCALLAVFRKRWQANRWGRQAVIWALLAAASDPLIRGLEYARGTDADLDVTIFVSQGTFLAMAALFLSPRFVIAAGIAYSAAVVATLYPEATPYAGMVNLLAGIAVFISVLTGRRKPG
jgi:hypothetical protein